MHTTVPTKLCLCNRDTIGSTVLQPKRNIKSKICPQPCLSPFLCEILDWTYGMWILLRWLRRVKKSFSVTTLPSTLWLTWLLGQCDSEHFQWPKFRTSWCPLPAYWACVRIGRLSEGVRSSGCTSGQDSWPRTPTGSQGGPGPSCGRPPRWAAPSPAAPCPPSMTASRGGSRRVQSLCWSQTAGKKGAQQRRTVSCSPWRPPSRTPWTPCWQCSVHSGARHILMFCCFERAQQSVMQVYCLYSHWRVPVCNDRGV